MRIYYQQNVQRVISFDTTLVQPINMDLDAAAAELEDTFNVLKPWSFGNGLTNVKITKEDQLVFNCHHGFWSTNGQPFYVPKEFLLSVDVIKHEDTAFRKSFRILNQKSKVFDKVLEVSVNHWLIPPGRLSFIL